MGNLEGYKIVVRGIHFRRGETSDYNLFRAAILAFEEKSLTESGNDCDPNGLGGFPQIPVEGAKLNFQPHRQFKVGCIIS